MRRLWGWSEKNKNDNVNDNEMIAMMLILSTVVEFRKRLRDKKSSTAGSCH